MTAKNAAPQPSTADGGRPAPFAAAPSGEGVGQGGIASAAPDLPEANHKEAYEFACIARNNSNLARAYISLRQEVERLRGEIEEYKRIRELCIKALIRATGYSRDAIECAPLTQAVKHAKEVGTLRSEKEAAERDAANTKIVLRRCLVKFLLPLYQHDAGKTADLCDNELDKSGALLGWLRDAAREIGASAGGEEGKT